MSKLGERPQHADQQERTASQPGDTRASCDLGHPRRPRRNPSSQHLSFLGAHDNVTRPKEAGACLSCYSSAYYA